MSARRIAALVIAAALSTSGVIGIPTGRYGLLDSARVVMAEALESESSVTAEPESDVFGPDQDVPEIDPELSGIDVEEIEEIASEPDAAPDQIELAAATVGTVCTANSQADLENACFPLIATSDVTIELGSNDNVTNVSNLTVTIPAGRNVVLTSTDGTASPYNRLTGVWFNVLGNLTITQVQLGRGNPDSADTQPLVTVGQGGTFTLDTGGTLQDNLNYGAITANSNAVINIHPGSTITGNSNTNGGGAIHLSGTSTLNMSGGTISGNSTTANGGAILVNSNDVNLNITGGSFVGNTSSGDGGGIYIEVGTSTSNSLTISNTNFTQNVASGSGGAIYAQGSTNLILTNDQLTANTATTGQGGGVYLRNGSTLVLNGTSVVNNTANGTAGEGGGIYVVNSGTITLNAGSAVTGNSAGTSGGGISVGPNANNKSSSVTLNNSVVTNNLAAQSGAGTGGGIDIGRGVSGTPALVTLNNSQVTGNRAGYNATGTATGFAASGGGIAASNYTTITTQGTNQVLNNQASAAGGGIDVGTNSTVSLDSTTTLSGNSAGTNGGGILIGNTSTLTLGGDTISANSAGTNGGGVYASNGSAVSVTAATLQGNTAGVNGGGIYLASHYASLHVTGAAEFLGNTATSGDGGGIWVRYASPADNELAGLTVESGATFADNRAVSVSPTRNPDDDELYSTNVFATNWSVGEDGATQLTQGYNNYDIAYSYTPPPPVYPPGITSMPFTGEEAGSSPWSVLGIAILAVGAIAIARSGAGNDSTARLNVGLTLTRATISTAALRH